MTNLGALGGIESLAFAINNRAQAVGEFTFVDSDGTGISHAFRWQGGLMQDLGTVTGDQASIALAINHHVFGTFQELFRGWSALMHGAKYTPE